MLSLPQLEVLKSEFIFNSWVNPFMGFNRGYRLEPSNKRAARRGARIYDLSIRLPSGEDMSIFLLPTASITWVGDTSILQDWIDLADYCNLTGTLFTVSNPVNGEMLDIGRCFITLISGVYPVLITPYLPGAVDVNIRMSYEPFKFVATKFELIDALGIPRIEDSIRSVPGAMRIFANGYYCDIDDINLLPRPSRGVIISDPYTKYITNAKLTTLHRYQHSDGAFFLIDLNTEENVIYHYTHCEFLLVHSIEKRGVAIDKSSLIENIHQVSNKMFGLRANYIENLCDIANIPVELAAIQIHVSKSPWEYLDNYGMNRLIENVTAITPSELVVNGDRRLNFVRASNLVESKYAKLQMMDLGNTKVTSDMFPQHVIDNRLMSLQAPISDPRVIARLLSGGQFNKYSAKLKYSRSNVDLHNYVFPAIYKYDHTPGEFGVDYYVSEDGVITLLNDAYVVDRNGRYETSVNRPYEIIELDSIPIFNHPEVHLEVTSGDKFLHPGVDYIRLAEGIIVWKENVSKVDIAMYLSSYHRSKTSWVLNEHVVVPRADVYGMQARINVFVGDEVKVTDHVIPARNGLPYTISYDLLDLFERDTNLKDINELRKEYDANIEVMRDYYERHDTDHEMSGFTDFYYLVSPFCMDVLKAIRNLQIDPTPDNIYTLGIEKCIPDELMEKYNKGYDPCTSNNANGMQFVIVKAHDESDLIDITPDEWNFLRHVNSVLLNGRITMELYYRIKYE